MTTLPKFEETITYPWSAKSGTKFPIHNPATGKILTSVVAATPTELDLAVQAAHKAYSTDWRWRSPAERSRLLFACAAALDAHLDELAVLLCLENGKPARAGRMYDLNFLVGAFRYYAGLVDKLPSQLYDGGSVYTNVFHEPYGVVGAILPFNWPPIHTGGKLAPALAMGNAVVLKPPEQAPLTIMRIIEILQTVLPKDVVHGVPGLGPDVPAALVSHPLVHKISFTGSTAAGAAVAKAAAADITPCTLELGGKNAFVVFEDADLDQAVRDALEGGFFNKGEACTAASRILVHRDIHDVFVQRLGAAIKKLVVGDGLKKDTHVGPQVTEAQQTRVLNYIRIGEEEGATISVQGSLPSDPALKDGYFVKPTLFTNVKPSMRIAKEEMFGPIQTVTSFSSYDEAIRIVNDSDYGLTAAVYTKDSEKGWKASREIDVGMVFLNNYWRAVLGKPFGGAKQSGYGREHTLETLLDFSRTKFVQFPSGLGKIPAWEGVTDIFGTQGSQVNGTQNGA
ncbi:MAG: hypothetical protein M1821_004807 [Bathelium mastoideum]|nr:MAG: hypothetical protein M1821_004807 [Bathelium mastoideum]